MADTLAEVLIDVLRTAAQLVNASLGSVQLLTPDGKLGMIGQIGFGDSILDQFAIVGLEDCSTCAVALNRRSRVIVRDLRADRTFTEIAAALRDYGAVAAVSTPILDKAGNVLAMFSLYWPNEHEPDDRELGALDLCAELAGRHVERSVAAKMLRDHNQRQALLMRELAHRGKNLLSIILPHTLSAVKEHLTRLATFLSAVLERWRTRTIRSQMRLPRACSCMTSYRLV